MSDIVRFQLLEDIDGIAALDEGVMVTDATPQIVVFKAQAVNEYNALAARAEAAEAENQRLTARVAELEAQLAAQGWRPPPPAPQETE